MSDIILPILVVIVSVGIFIFLYNQGYMVLKSMNAVTFVGSDKGNSAKFTACSGHMKRVIKFKADGTYAFVLDSELSKGDMSVELLDPAKQKIMHLDSSNRSATITAEEKKKYYLVIRLQSATGRYSMIRD